MQICNRCGKEQPGFLFVRTTKTCWICRRAREVLRDEAKFRVRYAIRKGDLKPAKRYKCRKSCGSMASEYHHPDYNKPLAVVPLCGSCHRKVHKRLRKIDNTQ